MGSDSLAPLLTTLAAVAIGSTYILVALRFYARFSVQKFLAADDYVLMFSQAIYTAYTVCILHAIKYGVGSHLMDAENLPLALKFWWLSQVLYVCTTCAVKIAVTVFFCSLRPPRYLRNIAIGTAYVSTINGIAYGSLIITICSPPSYFWNQFFPEYKGTCMDTSKAYKILMVLNTPNILTDIILSVLPCIMVRGMNMARGKKIAVSLLLGLSTLPAIVSIVREVYTHKTLFDVADFTYSAFYITITEIIEPWVGISVICIAQLRPLFKKIVPAGWLSKHKKSTANSPIVTFGQGSSGRRPKNEADVSLEDLIEDKTQLGV